MYLGKGGGGTETTLYEYIFCGLWRKLLAIHVASLTLIHPSLIPRPSHLPVLQCTKKHFMLGVVLGSETETTLT